MLPASKSLPQPPIEKRGTASAGRAPRHLTPGLPPARGALDAGGADEVQFHDDVPGGVHAVVVDLQRLSGSGLLCASFAVGLAHT